MESRKDFEDKVTEFIHRLPPMPGNVGELLDAANVQQMNDDELLAFVKQDPGLCTDLLHLANTFSIRPEGHDDTIEEAVNSVGIKPLIQLIGVWYARDIIAKGFNMLDHLGAIIFTCHFVACSDFTGDTLAAMLPYELLNKLNLTPEGFNKTQQIYFARLAES
jgi:hypothetical protein